MEDRGDVAEIFLTLAIRERLAEGPLDLGLTDTGVVFALTLFGVGFGHVLREDNEFCSDANP
jgi:hypothetical protein